jgi:hypothetical protein
MWTYYFLRGKYVLDCCTDIVYIFISRGLPWQQPLYNSNRQLLLNGRQQHVGDITLYKSISPGRSSYSNDFDKAMNDPPTLLNSFLKAE